MRVIVTCLAALRFVKVSGVRWKPVIWPGEQFSLKTMYWRLVVAQKALQVRQISLRQSLSIAEGLEQCAGFFVFPNSKLNVWYVDLNEQKQGTSQNRREGIEVHSVGSTQIFRTVFVLFSFFFFLFGFVYVYRTVCTMNGYTVPYVTLWHVCGKYASTQNTERYHSIHLWKSDCIHYKCLRLEPRMMQLCQQFVSNYQDHCIRYVLDAHIQIRHIEIPVRCSIQIRHFSDNHDSRYAWAVVVLF